MSLATSLTPAQKDELLALIAECRTLGATSRQLDPLSKALTVHIMTNSAGETFLSDTDDYPYPSFD